MLTLHYYGSIKLRRHEYDNWSFHDIFFLVVVLSEKAMINILDLVFIHWFI